MLITFYHCLFLS